MKHYADLYALLREDSDAREYFASLPLYVRTSINDRPQTINSFASLKSYVENFQDGC